MATTTNGQRQPLGSRTSRPARPSGPPAERSDTPVVTPDVTDRTAPGAPVGPARRRRWSRVALAVILIVVCGLGGAFLFQQSSKSVEVVAVRQTVHRGSVLTAADLTTVSIGQTPGIATVPASQLAGQVGQIASYDLVAGSLLNANALTTDPQPALDHAQVGLRLQPGQIPTETLPPGTPLTLVYAPASSDNTAGAGTSTASGSASAAAPPTVRYLATVVSERPQADGNAVLLTVDVAETNAPLIAQLAAAGNLGVIRMSERH